MKWKVNLIVRYRVLFVLLVTVFSEYSCYQYFATICLWCLCQSAMFGVLTNGPVSTLHQRQCLQFLLFSNLQVDSGNHCKMQQMAHCCFAEKLLLTGQLNFQEHAFSVQCSCLHQFSIIESKLVSYCIKWISVILIRTSSRPTWSHSPPLHLCKPNQCDVVVLKHLLLPGVWDYKMSVIVHPSAGSSACILE